MSKKIRCPHCGHRFEESGWSKAGRYGIYTVEGVIKIGARLGMAILTQGRGPIVGNAADKAAQAATGGTSNEFTWGDLVCPVCKKSLGNP